MRLIIFILIFTQISMAGEPCMSTFAEYKSVGQYFHKKNKQLYKQGHIQISAKKNTLKEPAIMIAQWFEILERKIQTYSSDRILLKNMLKGYHKKYVIKLEEIPENYYKLQQRLARERGQGDIQLTDAQRTEMGKILIEDQKSSLNTWLKYLASSETSHYPSWAKYWVFNSVVKLGVYEPEKTNFKKRSKGLTSPFPELNREAFTYVITSFTQKIRKQRIDIRDKDFLKILESGNFGKMYAHQLKVFNEKTLELAHLQRNVEGKWVRYKKGSNHEALVNSLKGKNTGWCTAGACTAKSQLASGDLHVFYSLNELGKPNIPRLAIRMEDDKIAEVRGVGKKQNLDPIIAGTSILSEKLKSFADEGKAYLKKDKDMKLLTEIDHTLEKQGILNISQLRFLYEIDSPIEGFGFEKDPRIANFKEHRNIKADLSKIFDTPEKHITLDMETMESGKLELRNILAGKSKIHYGNLKLNQHKELDENILPEYLLGYLFFSRKTFKNTIPKFPKNLEGFILENSGNLENYNLVTSAKSITLSGVNSLKNTKFDESLESLSLNFFRGFNSTTWPENLKSITVNGESGQKITKFPMKVRRIALFGDFDLNGVKVPNSVIDFQAIDLKKLTNIQLPNRLEHLHTNKVEFISNVKFPASLSYVSLRNLRSIEGSLDLSGLDKVHIIFSNLESTQGLILPKGKARISIKKQFYLENKDFFDQPNIVINQIL